MIKYNPSKIEKKWQDFWDKNNTFLSKIDNNSIKENDLFDKKIFNKSKGSLKLLNVGKLKDNINLEISFASKKAIEVIENMGGKIKLTKK